MQVKMDNSKWYSFCNMLCQSDDFFTDNDDSSIYMNVFKEGKWNPRLFASYDWSTNIASLHIPNLESWTNIET